MATGTPTHFVDVTGTIDAGIASLREHQAYIDGLGTDFDPDEFLRNMAGYVGLGGGRRIRGGAAPVPHGMRLRAGLRPGADLSLEYEVSWYGTLRILGLISLLRLDLIRLFFLNW